MAKSDRKALIEEIKAEIRAEMLETVKSEIRQELEASYRAELEESLKPTCEPVTFFNQSYDRKIYVHPHRHSEIKRIDGREVVVKHPNPVARFIPQYRMSGGFYTTDDPGMVSFLREKMKEDPDLIEVTEGVNMEPARKPDMLRPWQKAVMGH